MHVMEVPITQLAAARMNGCNTRGTWLKAASQCGMIISVPRDSFRLWVLSLTALA